VVEYNAGMGGVCTCTLYRDTHRNITKVEWWLYCGRGTALYASGVVELVGVEVYEVCFAIPRLWKLTVRLFTELIKVLNVTYIVYIMAFLFLSWAVVELVFD